MNVFDVEAINAQIEINKKEIDEFAIGFGHWLDDLIVDNIALYDNKKMTELLEIYKKENGL